MNSIKRAKCVVNWAVIASAATACSSVDGAADRQGQGEVASVTQLIRKDYTGVDPFGVDITQHNFHIARDPSSQVPYEWDDSLPYDPFDENKVKVCWGAAGHRDFLAGCTVGTTGWHPTGDGAQLGADRPRMITAVAIAPGSRWTYVYYRNDGGNGYRVSSGTPTAVASHSNQRSVPVIDQTGFSVFETVVLLDCDFNENNVMSYYWYRQNDGFFYRTLGDSTHTGGSPVRVTALSDPSRPGYPKFSVSWAGGNVETWYAIPTDPGFYKFDVSTSGVNLWQ